MAASADEGKLLSPTTKEFVFCASDYGGCTHGKFWVNGIIPTIIGIFALSFGEWKFGLIVGGIGLSLLVIFLPFDCCYWSTVHKIIFNDEERVITIYRGKRQIHSCPYHEFGRLEFNSFNEGYCIFWCFCIWCRWGEGRYSAA